MGLFPHPPYALTLARLKVGCPVVRVSPRVTEEDETALTGDGSKNLPTCANPLITDP